MDTPAEDDSYLLPGEVAKLLHVSPKTVTRWASAGFIPCVITLGGHRRFRRSDIEAVRREMENGGVLPD